MLYNNVHKKILNVIVIFAIIALNSAQADSSVSAGNYSDGRDIVIVLDPGHGGSQSGAVNKNRGLVQKDINLKIAKYALQELQRYSNIKVYLTHYGLSSKEELTIQERADIAKSYNADMLVSLHINACGDRGAEIFVSYKDKYFAKSKKFGNIFLKKLGNLGIANVRGGVKIRTSEDNTRYPDGTIADYYGIIRNSYLNDIPAVLVEHCFIDSSDTKFIDTDEKLKALGRADAAAIVEYYGLVEHDVAGAAFKDTVYHWARNYIDRWYEAGYISGSNGRFRPNDSISRAEFVTMLNNLFQFEASTENPFADVKETDWYKDAVLSAYKMNIIAGNNGLFLPNDKITREQACVIITKLFNYEPADANTIDKFKDKNNISHWAKDSVISMVANGIMTGNTKNELLPGGKLTRAEAVVLIDKAMAK